MKHKILLYFVIIFCTEQFAFASQYKPINFEQVFSQWTEAFNHKDLTSACALFSTDVVANYKGVPEKNYANICGGFKKVFAQTDRHYQYRFKLHQTYQSPTLAAARITWYLDIYKNNQLISSTKDEGLDIFERSKTGEWKIVNYLGYQD